MLDLLPNIKVANQKDPFGRSAIQIFIGRPSVLGNVFILENENRRKEVLALYRHFLRQASKVDGPIRNELLKILEIAKTGVKIELQCFCKPKDCHGDIIKEILEEMLLEENENE